MYLSATYKNTLILLTVPLLGLTIGIQYRPKWRFSTSIRDDTILLASTQEKAKKIFKDLILESAQYNMQINAKKTKAMVVTRNEGTQAKKMEHEHTWIK